MTPLPPTPSFFTAAMRRHARGALVTAALVAASATAHADGRLDIRYDISVATISVGEAIWTTTFTSDRYVTSATGKTRGVASFLFGGEGHLTTRGTIANGELDTATFTATVTQDDEKTDVRMRLRQGDVEALAVTATALPHVRNAQDDERKDRVPIEERHRHGIVDPLTALLVPSAAFDETGVRDACTRTLPIFDGRRRFDLALRYKSVARMKAPPGYDGPVVVCAVALHPIAGHRVDGHLMKYLTDGRAIEIAFAPIGGEKRLAPLRFTISSMLGDFVIQATRFSFP